MNYYYPASCFSSNIAATQAAKREYEIKINAWYEKLYELYPNYHKLSPREQMKARDEMESKGHPRPR